MLEFSRKGIENSITGRPCCHKLQTAHTAWNTTWNGKTKAHWETNRVWREQLLSHLLQLTTSIRGTRRFSINIHNAATSYWGKGNLGRGAGLVLTSTSSPLGFSLNHFTTQVRPTWSPDCTTPYIPGSRELCAIWDWRKDSSVREETLSAKYNRVLNTFLWGSSSSSEKASRTKSC